MLNKPENEDQSPEDKIRGGLNGALESATALGEEHREKLLRFLITGIRLASTATSERAIASIAAFDRDVQVMVEEAIERLQAEQMAPVEDLAKRFATEIAPEAEAKAVKLVPPLEQAIVDLDESQQIDPAMPDFLKRETKVG